MRTTNERGSARAGFTLVELILIPVVALLGAGLHWVIGLALDLEPGISYWRAYAGCVVLGYAALIDTHEVIKGLIGLGGSIAIFVAPIFRVPAEGPLEPAQAVAEALDVPGSTAAAPQQPSELAVTGMTAGTAANAASASAAVPEVLRGDFHPVGVGSCPATAIMTITSSRILVDGCATPDVNGLVSVKSVDVDVPLYTLDSGASSPIVMKRQADGSLSVFQPAQWKGTWKR
jgi:hypothetical protein